MKKSFLLLFLFCSIFTINVHAQIVFEKGYFINNSGEKIECLIKNVDWRNTPTEFEYMLDENSESEILTSETVKEFSVYNSSKFVRSKVKIDKSSNDVNSLTDNKYPEFKEEELFLKVLVEGEASLYQYVYRNLKKYFYSKEGEVEITQLVYKRYKTEDENIGNNNQFRQQLRNSLKCATLKTSKVDQVDYIIQPLVKLFVEYNTCSNQEFVNFAKKKKRDFFSLAIRPGLNNSSLSIDFIGDSRGKFDGTFGPRLGLEAEFILPFNKNKWAITVEPTYQSYSSKQNTVSLQGTIAQEVEVDYKSIEIPLGLRYYMFLNDKSKLFWNGAVVLDISGEKSAVDYTPGLRLDIDSKPNFAFGLGYKYNKRYSLEIRYYTDRELLGRYAFWGSNYKTLSLIVGYSFL